jgi:hypothetical protein
LTTNETERPGFFSNIFIALKWESEARTDVMFLIHWRKTLEKKIGVFD